MPINATNWSGHHTFAATRLHYPETVAEVQAIVARSRKVKVVGAGHSFHDIADCTEDLISLERLNQPIAIDPAQQTATVSGGATYIQISEPLQRAGYALRNLASLPHITVVGACATGTHGSGDAIGNLSSAVAGLELVTASGEVVQLSRTQQGDQFLGAVVNVGALGVVTKVTLDIVPTFNIGQVVYENMAQSQAEAHFDAIMSSAYSVSLFTDWQEGLVSQTWLKHKLTNDQPPEVTPTLYGAPLAPTHRHPVTARPADACTPQMGIPGLWHDRLPHFRLDSVLTGGAELQTEYFVARQHAVAALQAIASLHREMVGPLVLSEVRSMAADELWLSPAYQQETIGFHFSWWRKEWPAVERLLPQIEEKLAPFQARPHWGKLFAMSPAQVQALYPRFADFQKLMRTYDPTGKFRNRFIDTYFGN